MKILEKLQLVKEVITQLVVFQIIHISKFKIIAVDLSKQQALDFDPKAIQQINFTANLDRAGNMFFIVEEAKETVLDFSQGTVKAL